MKEHEWAGNAARMGKENNASRALVGIPEER